MFGKKQKKVSTIQEAQAKFNNTLFNLGNIRYQKHMVSNELTRLNVEDQRLVQELDKIGKEAKLLSEKAKAEVKSTIKKSEEPNAEPSDESNSAA